MCLVMVDNVASEESVALIGEAPTAQGCAFRCALVALTRDHRPNLIRPPCDDGVQKRRTSPRPIALPYPALPFLRNRLAP